MTTPATPTSFEVVAALAAYHARPVFDKTERSWLKAMISETMATDREHADEKAVVQKRHTDKVQAMKEKYGDNLDDCMVPLSEKMELLQMQHRLQELERSTTFNAKLKQMYEQALGNTVVAGDGSSGVPAPSATATGASTGAAVTPTGAAGASLSGLLNPTPPPGDTGGGNGGDEDATRMKDDEDGKKGDELVSQGDSADAADAAANEDVAASALAAGAPSTEPSSSAAAAAQPAARVCERSGCKVVQHAKEPRRG